MTTKYKVAPSNLLEQLEEERVRLWGLFNSADLKDIPPELSQITGLMWKLANTKFPDYEEMIKEVLEHDRNDCHSHW